MKPFIYFTITAIFWGLNFHLAKIMLEHVKFIEAGFWRYLFGVIPLFLLAYRDLPSIGQILHNLKGLLLVGVVCLFGFNFFFFLGLRYSPAINGALIISITPALTLLFSNRILKTPLRRKEVIGVLISFIGVIYLILKGNLSGFRDIEFSWGDILLLTSSMFFALQNVWVKKYSGHISNRNFTFLTNLLCMLSFLILLPFIGIEPITTHSFSFWFAALGIGFLGTALAYFLWNAGIQLTGANQAGIFINVVPLSAALFAILFGETLYGYHLISGLFIILGVVIIVTNVETLRKFSIRNF